MVSLLHHSMDDNIGVGGGLPFLEDHLSSSKTSDINL